MTAKLIPEGAPPLYSQQDVADPMVVAKLFTPCSSWTWLITEFSPEEQLAFGYCYDASFPEGAELGYVSVEELTSLTSRGMPLVERDRWFTPKRLSQAIAEECPDARWSAGQ